MGSEGMGVWELPKGWEWVSVDSVVLRTERRNPTKSPDEPFVYVEISSIDSEIGAIVSPRKLQGQEAPSRARKVIHSGDVIFATTRPYLGNIALVPDRYDDQICSTGFCVLRANRDLIEPRWLYYLCRSDVVLDQVLPKMRGASYPAVTDGDILVSEIPLPPLDEQRRIVACIEELFAHIEEARGLRAAADQDAERLMPAAMRGVFTFNGELPAGWEWKTVKEVGDTERAPVQTGPFGAQLKSSEFVDAGVPVLAIGNVQWGYLDISDLKHVTPQKADRLSRYRVKAGDILFTRMGTVGRSCLVPPEADDWLISYHLLRVAVDKRRCEPKYLSYCFRGAPQIEEQIEKRSRGATRAGVNTAILADLRFPAAPLAEQRRIVEYLDAVQAQVAELKRLQAESAVELERLSGAILARAFRGEL